jgi:SpoVK/Ycf46/Vps4 family AAA+-type ATPase
MLVNLGRLEQIFSANQRVGEELLGAFRLNGLQNAEHPDLPAIRAALKAQLDLLEARRPGLPPGSVLGRNLAYLGEMMSLTPCERDILAFLLLAHQSSALERLLDSLGSMTGTAFIAILAATLKHGVPLVRRALAPGGRLAQSGLVELNMANTWTFTCKVELMPGLYERLSMARKDTFGIFCDSFIQGPAASLTPEAFPHLAQDMAILRPYLQEALRLKRKGVNILLHGRPGGGKTQFARMMAAALGCGLFEVATETESREPIQGERRFRSYRLSQTILAGRGRNLVLFDEVEDVFQGLGESPLSGTSNRSGIKAWVNRMLEDNPVPAFWITNQLWVVDPAFRRRFDYVLELDVPPRSVRARMLEGFLEGLPVDPAWSATMAEHQDLVPAVVERSAKVVRDALVGDPDLDVAKALPWALGNSLEALGSSREPRCSAVACTRYRPEALNTDYDLAAMIPGLRSQKAGRLCLYGPPGTGKTAFGLHLARELDLPLMVRRASDLLGMYVGENEKNLARMFAEARQEGALLLLDEADSFLQDRSGAQRSWEITLVNEMLTQLEAFPGIFVASTNLLDTLEPAALRRFEMKVRFDYLRPEQALLLFEDLAETLALPVDDAARTALRGMARLTPGDFAAVARQVRFQPAATADELAGRLRGECELKPEGRRKTIGF